MAVTSCCGGDDPAVLNRAASLASAPASSPEGPCAFDFLSVSCAAAASGLRLFLSAEEALAERSTTLTEEAGGSSVGGRVAARIAGVVTPTRSGAPEDAADVAFEAVDEEEFGGIIGIPEVIRSRRDRTRYFWLFPE
ncbi:hypothetical protein JI739_04190 [Ramlibacter sp. AW1]|uniref:Uncharacterized protein n=1 Tax=Ramlibacter aurantiacus TaxID=2801330 RepID=A0A937D548_9BURK|nr:hypothetical protein [Ramlibacter aurantiacus]MBL0419543.1 hypothetical protein [Ramlibacter aurantiacus]